MAADAELDDVCCHGTWIGGFGFIFTRIGFGAEKIVQNFACLKDIYVHVRVLKMLHFSIGI